MSPPRLPELSDLSAGRDSAFTTGSLRGTREWRVHAARTAAGVTVAALPLDEVRATVGQLAAINAVTGLVVLALLGVASWYAVRASLRPLIDVETTAGAIAAGDLSRRVPAADPRTEVGRLSSAFNVMVDRFESAYRAQQESEAQARAGEERMRHFAPTPATSCAHR